MRSILNEAGKKGYANVECKQRVPHLHSFGGYGLISNAKETQPTTFLIFNVAGKCEKNWTLPWSVVLAGDIPYLRSAGSWS